MALHPVSIYNAANKIYLFDTFLICSQSSAPSATTSFLSTLNKGVAVLVQMSEIFHVHSMVYLEFPALEYSCEYLLLKISLSVSLVSYMMFPKYL